ncbi:hypothetical protein ITX54_10190 [Rouxiella silvae]|uniref:Uncharacterized protein n=1 Tax=Rouxiella silvae TaxID=1646373 RepID=A0AA41BWY7_9GAMM|nr:hypothetical protein [Rouxiella silvae]MBF6637018.1 hypothetical protein [Rouxiella silvae]
MSESLWIHYARPRPHWYRLSAEQQQEKRAVWAELAEKAQQQGAKHVGQYHVRGQHDFETVEVWQFPTPEAAFAYWASLAAAAYNEWFAFSNNVGMQLEKPAYEYASS